MPGSWRGSWRSSACRSRSGRFRSGRRRPRTSAGWGIRTSPGIALIQWTPDFVDPFAYINRLLDGRPAGGTDLARFDEPLYRDLMRKASRLQGAARERAYAELDLRLTRYAAPVVPLYVVSEATLVSKRVPKRCMLLRPALVLTTVCLKR